jgi:hypothetical protein
MRNPMNFLQHPAPERFREPGELRRSQFTETRYGRAVLDGCMSPPLDWTAESDTANALVLARSAMPVGEFHSHGCLEDWLMRGEKESPPPSNVLPDALDTPTLISTVSSPFNSQTQAKDPS